MAATFRSSQPQRDARQRVCCQDELISKDSNAPGTLAMANCGQPNTGPSPPSLVALATPAQFAGGSQFFINVADNSFLDWFSPGDAPACSLLGGTMLACVLEVHQNIRCLGKLPAATTWRRLAGFMSGCCVQRLWDLGATLQSRDAG